MNKTKALTNFLSVRESNTNKLQCMFDQSMTKLVNQGTGCFDESGVRYFNPVNKTMDSVYIIMGRTSNIFHFYGPISEEAQKPLVNAIIRMFGFNEKYESERVRCIDLLQAMQDAHDKAFDPFLGEQYYPIGIFLGEYKKIATKFNLKWEQK
jgi:hypothetical protein